MYRLRKFLGLSFADQRLLLSAWVLVTAVRLGLWLLPFSAVRRLLARMARPERDEMSRPSQSQVAWAVGLTSRYVPKATCLTQALAARSLLAWFGYEVSLRIGVARSKDGVFEAHAWVESGETVLLGGSEAGVKRFTVLPSLDEKGL